MNRYTDKDIQTILRKTLSALPRDACHTCECLQGFLVQLQADAADDVEAAIAPHRVSRDQMHACLGCSPCPPADVFAEYLKQQ